MDVVGIFAWPARSQQQTGFQICSVSYQSGRWWSARVVGGRL